ncbi:response regulator [Chryseolinea sp. Jin1]|uniref:Response regulator n=1 Tax=Chryseolinea lacunae TaxID=2801331 RepID=A0ABS1KNI6_9BACT|nr:response regulator [Chryseolinea lacunae]
MTKTGPIIVIEDDQDDQDILEETFRNLNYPNRIIFFKDGLEALAFIEKTDIKPFLILSDVNMPTINGFELRKLIYNNAELSVRCIPYLFFTTGTNKQGVQDAYAMSAQGFFIKPNSMTALENTIRKIVEYWQECHAPSQYAD